MTGFALGGQFLTFLTTLLTFITTGIVLWQTIGARRQAAAAKVEAEKATAQGVTNAGHIKTLTENTDGITSRLVELTAKSSLAEGALGERDRRDAADVAEVVRRG